MEWGKQQHEAITAVKTWLNDPKRQVFRLFGYAGTGKTTLAKHLAQQGEGLYLFAAFTGKAAHVLRTKGCEEATTIHSLIYLPKEKGEVKLRELELNLQKLKRELSDQGVPEEQITNHRRVYDLKELIRQENQNLSRPAFSLNSDSIVKEADCIIIDECSMVDEYMGKDLLSFGTKVLVLGDPAQLPPVKGQGYFTDSNPDYMLTDIHRQAQESPIIKMATQVRQGGVLPLGSYGESKVIEKENLDRNEILECGQVIVGKNKTRYLYNGRIRQLKGFTSALPQKGDKLVCLKNNNDLGLLNGAIWMVQEVGVYDEDNEKITLTIYPEGGDPSLAQPVYCHTHHFLNKELNWKEKREAQEFDFGYALTCHKSQGSQWDHVVLFDESASFRSESKKWLYTGITRAAEKITIVRI